MQQLSSGTEWIEIAGSVKTMHSMIIDCWTSKALTEMQEEPHSC